MVPKDFQHPGGASSASDSAPGARRNLDGASGRAQGDRNVKKRSQREKPAGRRAGLPRPPRTSRGATRKRNAPNVCRFVHSAGVPLPRKASVPLRSFNLLRLALGARGKLRDHPGERKRPARRKTARSGKSCQAVTEMHLHAILGTSGSGVRAAEGARLEIAWAGLTRLEGSNPSHSVRGGAGSAG